ncbi:hypothetical protein Vafri_8568, partial [Volvox africanus]
MPGAASGTGDAPSIDAAARPCCAPAQGCGIHLHPQAYGAITDSQPTSHRTCPDGADPRSRQYAIARSQQLPLQPLQNHHPHQLQNHLSLAQALHNSSNSLPISRADELPTDGSLLDVIHTRRNTHPSVTGWFAAAAAAAALAAAAAAPVAEPSPPLSTPGNDTSARGTRQPRRNAGFPSAAAAGGNANGSGRKASTAAAAAAAAAATAAAAAAAAGAEAVAAGQVLPSGARVITNAAISIGAGRRFQMAVHVRRKDNREPFSITLDLLRTKSKGFSLDIAETAKEVGVCATVMKRACRALGLINGWPFRVWKRCKYLREAYLKDADRLVSEAASLQQQFPPSPHNAAKAMELRSEAARLRARVEEVDAWWTGVVSNPVGRELQGDPFFINNVVRWTQSKYKEAHRLRAGNGRLGATGRKRGSGSCDGDGDGGSGADAEAVGTDGAEDYGNGDCTASGDCDLDMEDPEERDWGLGLNGCIIIGDPAVSGDDGGDKDTEGREDWEQTAPDVDNNGPGVTPGADGTAAAPQPRREVDSRKGAAVVAAAATEPKAGAATVSGTTVAACGETPMDAVGGVFNGADITTAHDGRRGGSRSEPRIRALASAPLPRLPPTWQQIPSSNDVLALTSAVPGDLSSDAMMAAAAAAAAAQAQYGSQLVQNQRPSSPDMPYPLAALPRNTLPRSLGHFSQSIEEVMLMRLKPNELQLLLQQHQREYEQQDEHQQQQQQQLLLQLQLQLQRTVSEREAKRQKLLTADVAAAAAAEICQQELGFHVSDSQLQMLQLSKHVSNLLRNRDQTRNMNLSLSQDLNLVASFDPMRNQNANASGGASGAAVATNGSGNGNGNASSHRLHHIGSPSWGPSEELFAHQQHATEDASTRADGGVGGGGATAGSLRADKGDGTGWAPEPTASAVSLKRIRIKFGTSNGMVGVSGNAAARISVGAAPAFAAYKNTPSLDALADAAVAAGDGRHPVPRDVYIAGGDGSHGSGGGSGATDAAAGPLPRAVPRASPSAAVEAEAPQWSIVPRPCSPYGYGPASPPLASAPPAATGAVVAASASPAQPSSFRPYGGSGGAAIAATADFYGALAIATSDAEPPRRRQPSQSSPSAPSSPILPPDAATTQQQQPPGGQAGLPSWQFPSQPQPQQQPHQGSSLCRQPREPVTESPAAAAAPPPPPPPSMHLDESQMARLARAMHVAGAGDLASFVGQMRAQAAAGGVGADGSGPQSSEPTGSKTQERPKVHGLPQLQRIEMVAAAAASSAYFRKQPAELATAAAQPPSSPPLPSPRSPANPCLPPASTTAARPSPPSPPAAAAASAITTTATTVASQLQLAPAAGGGRRSPLRAHPGVPQPTNSAALPALLLHDLQKLLPAETRRAVSELLMPSEPRSGSLQQQPQPQSESLIQELAQQQLEEQKQRKQQLQKKQQEQDRLEETLAALAGQVSELSVQLKDSRHQVQLLELRVQVAEHRAQVAELKLQMAGQRSSAGITEG